MIPLVAAAAEMLPLPDPILRFGVAALVGGTARRLARVPAEAEAAFAAAFDRYPIALHCAAANEQHYALPPEFFALVLGPRRKYSSCLFDSTANTLAQAEARALAETCAHAALADGQAVLELGCGWGALSLWMAEHYPAARITAVSNSAPQRAFIAAEAARRGFANLRVVTADMNAFAPDATFDRVVSVEMFEHMANWRALLGRIANWLRPEGRVFLHVFAHRKAPYRFDHTNPADWIGRYFFTGGLMPSHGLLRHASDVFEVEQDWWWNGTHYQRTADAWITNFDRNRDAIGEILKGVYGREAARWQRRWRLFFLATSGLFGHAGGEVWGVTHARLKART